MQTQVVDTRISRTHTNTLIRRHTQTAGAALTWFSDASEENLVHGQRVAVVMCEQLAAFQQHRPPHPLVTLQHKNHHSEEAATLLRNTCCCFSSVSDAAVCADAKCGRTQENSSRLAGCSAVVMCNKHCSQFYHKQTDAVVTTGPVATTTSVS